MDKVACQQKALSWIMTSDNMWRMTAGSEHTQLCGELRRWLRHSLQGIVSDPAPESILCICSKEITEVARCRVRL